MSLPRRAGDQALSLVPGALIIYFCFDAGWVWLSGQWSHAPGRALLDFDRDLLYVLALGLFGSVPRTSETLKWMLRGVATGAFVVCICGLFTRLLPDVWPTSPGIANQRLS